MNEREIFFRALEKTSLEERTGFLDGACGNDAGLRHKVDQLLVEHFATDDLLRQPAVDREATLEDAMMVSEGPGELIGRYKLLQKIGEGGFGVVYMAEQKEPVKRRVALKIIKLGMDTKQVVGRFEAERQALAMMDHLNISTVLDAGATESGRPFFVMELVKGIPITQYCDENQLTTKARLKLFIPVCQAIQHAHQKGIIHRDIKPSNIMITHHDGEPVPKVIDFGIAKATQQELTEKTVFTQYSQFIGTPAYMSPEQAEMSGLDIDTRSDVYSLGVLLYELLTGKTPLDGRELMSGGYDEIKRRIREEEPPKPSTRVSTMEYAEQTDIAKQRKIEPSKLSGQIRGDLDWIVMKALEKDRTRRYETANGFAADVGRFLRNEPVSAVAPTLSYQMLKFYLRNRAFVRVAMGMILVLAMATMISAWQAYRATVARREVTVQRDVAEVARTSADEARRSEARARLDAESAQAKAEISERGALILVESERRQSYAADMNMVQRHLEQNNLGRARHLLNRHRPDAGQLDLRGWEWRYLWGVTWGDHLRTLVKGPRPSIMSHIDLSPDGGLITLNEGGMDRVSVWDLERGEHAFDLTLQKRRRFRSIRPVFSPIGGQFAYVNEARKLLLMDVATRNSVAELALPQRDISGMEYSPDGEEILVCSDAGDKTTIHRWKWRSSAMVDEWKGVPVTCFKWALGNALTVDWESQSAILSGQIHGLDMGGICRLDLNEKSVRWSYSRGGVFPFLSTVICQERNTVFAGEGLAEGDILEIDYETGELRNRLVGHSAWVARLEVVDEGKTLVSCSADQTIRLWDLTTPLPRIRRVLRGHDWEVRDFAIHPNGRELISASKDGTVRSWSIAEEANQQGRIDIEIVNDDWIFGSDNSIYALDSKTAGRPKLWRISGKHFSGVDELNLAGVDLSKSTLLRDRDEAFLAEGSDSGRIRVWNLSIPAKVSEVTIGNEPIKVLRASRLAKLNLLFPNRKELQVWDLSASPPTDRGLRLQDIDEGNVPLLDDRIVWGSVSGPAWQGFLQIFSDEGRSGSEVEMEPGYIMGSSFTPDGRHCFVSHEPGIIAQYTYDDESNRVALTRRYAGSPMGYRTPGFTADSRRMVATGSGRYMVGLWDVEIGAPLITLPGAGVGKMGDDPK